MEPQVEAISQAISQMEAALQAQAERLCAEFEDARTALKAEERDRWSAQGGRGKQSLFAPLFLYQRIHRAELELAWGEVHYNRRDRTTEAVRQFRYLERAKPARDKPAEYSLRMLAKSAKTYEKALVTQTELKARGIRGAWGALAEVRRALRKVSKRVAVLEE